MPAPAEAFPIFAQQNYAEQRPPPYETLQMKISGTQSTAARVRLQPVLLSWLSLLESIGLTVL